jgi:hypothetical protein
MCGVHLDLLVYGVICDVFLYFGVLESALD